MGESLNKLVEQARIVGIVSGFCKLVNGSTITHLQFDDDTLFFCEPNKKEVLSYKAILTCFELVSGLKINIGKSTMIGIEMARGRLKEFADEIGCGIGKIPFIYLGLPVGGNPRRLSFWTPGGVGNIYL